jgi:hypothetical protein
MTTYLVVCEAVTTLSSRSHSTHWCFIVSMHMEVIAPSDSFPPGQNLHHHIRRVEVLRWRRCAGKWERKGGEVGASPMSEGGWRGSGEVGYRWNGWGQRPCSNGWTLAARGGGEAWDVATRAPEIYGKERRRSDWGTDNGKRRKGRAGLLTEGKGRWCCGYGPEELRWLWWLRSLGAA